MKSTLEPVCEQVLKHPVELIQSRGMLHLGIDVVSLLAHPTRRPHDLIGDQMEGSLGFTDATSKDWLERRPASVSAVRNA
jgi:hypothetical protein